MPTYEYLCAKCKKPYEALQSITAKPLTRCPRPKCGGKLTRQLGSGSGFIFKGSGFYITDNRSKSYKEGKAKDQPASKPADTSKGSCASGGGSCKSGACS